MGPASIPPHKPPRGKVQACARPVTPDGAGSGKRRGRQRALESQVQVRLTLTAELGCPGSSPIVPLTGLSPWRVDGDTPCRRFSQMYWKNESFERKSFFDVHPHYVLSQRRNERRLVGERCLCVTFSPRRPVSSPGRLASNLAGSALKHLELASLVRKPSSVRSSPGWVIGKLWGPKGLAHSGDSVTHRRAWQPPPL